jgi:hypothetical protein
MEIILPKKHFNIQPQNIKMPAPAAAQLKKTGTFAWHS